MKIKQHSKTEKKPHPKLIILLLHSKFNCVNNLCAVFSLQ